MAPPVVGPSAPTDIFLTIFGRTDLMIGASKAKNGVEFDFEVRLPMNPPKLAQKDQKQLPTPKNFVEKNFFSPKIEMTGII